MGKGTQEPTVFRLDASAPETAMQEAVCARLQQLRAMATVMEGKDFYVHPPAILQGYAWTLVDLVDEVQELFFTLWEKERPRHNGANGNGADLAEGNTRTALGERLRDGAVAAEYLNAALEDEDSALILMALRNIAEAQEGGIAGVARRAGLEPASVDRILSLSGSGELTNVARVIRGLGFRLEARAGY